jgi:hypothetical protein
MPWLSPDDFKKARQMAEEEGKKLGEILANSFGVSRWHVLQAEAHVAGMRAVDLERIPPQPEALGTLSAELVRRHRVLPVAIANGYLVIALPGAPIPEEALEEIRQAVDRPIAAVLAFEDQVTDHIDRHYARD